MGNIYKILLREKLIDKDTEQNSAAGEHVRSLLQTMFPETDGYRIRFYEYKPLFYRWFIRVSNGLVSGFVVKISSPKKNKLFIKIYEESKFSIEFNAYSVLFAIITFLTVLISRIYLHKEKYFLAALVYSVFLMVLLIILKKIIGIILTAVLGKKISPEDINNLGEKLKQQLS